MHLRKVCNHPFVFPEVEEQVNHHQLNLDIYRTSGKFELLDRILPKLFQSGHKVLIFFQMVTSTVCKYCFKFADQTVFQTHVMDVFEDYLRWRKHTWLRLDGSNTADARQDMLLKFNAPDSPYNLFILSTRAGGLGLNLQVADTVIIFDSDWNPHQDLQAQDRAHRIGQKNEVRILRLITTRSIEETILQRAQFKLDMDGKVIQAGKFDNKSSAEEREAFLRALIENAEDEVDEENADEAELNDEELNEVIARSSDELVLFREMDEARAQLDVQDWMTAGPITLGRARNRDRLMQEEEIPDLYRVEHEREDLDELFDAGRGRRAHRDVVYDDGLTEEQFANAVDAGNLSSKQHKAQNKLRKRRGLGDAASDSGRGDDDAASQSQQYSDDDSSSVGVGKKRPRSTRESSEGDEKLTKKQRKELSEHLNGRDPLEMRDVLKPRIRRKMMQIMEDCFRVMEEAITYDAYGRPRKRSERFWPLPLKKQYPELYKAVPRPVSLYILQTRTRYPFYTSLEQFVADADLMFDTTCKFNGPDTEIYHDAVELKRLLHARYDQLAPLLIAAAMARDDEVSDSEQNSPVKAARTPQAQSFPGVGFPASVWFGLVNPANFFHLSIFLAKPINKVKNATRRISTRKPTRHARRIWRPAATATLRPAARRDAGTKHRLLHGSAWKRSIDNCSGG
jgi:ATP-dependent helicase STH1/SNF2